MSELPLKMSQLQSNASSFIETNTTAAVGDVYDGHLWAWRIGLFGVGGLVVGCLGIVGNIISIVVLAHFREKRSAHIILISLSVFDTIYLIAELALENVTYVAKGGLIDDGYRVFIRPVYGNIFPLPAIAKFCVSYTVIVITIERFVAVVWPFKAQLSSRRWVAGVSVAMVMAASLLYHIPLYLAFDYSYEWDNQADSKVFRFFRTEFGLSHFYNRIYHTWINLAVNFLVPFALLLVLNTKMMASLRKSTAVVNSKTRESQEHKLTIMIVSMIVIFFFCSLFPAIAFILTTGMTSFTQCSHACNRFSALADLLQIVNSAINFVIYCATGQNFRDVFKELFCFSCRGWKCVNDQAKRYSLQSPTRETMVWSATKTAPVGALQKNT